jgi:hypothetical protein
VQYVEGVCDNQLNVLSHTECNNLNLLNVWLMLATRVLAGDKTEREFGDV